MARSRAVSRTIARAARERWPISQAQRAAAVQAIHEAMKAAQGRPRTIASLTRTLATLEGQNQADQLAREKNARLDDGRPTERMAVEPIILERPV